MTIRRKLNAPLRITAAVAGTRILTSTAQALTFWVSPVNEWPDEARRNAAVNALTFVIDRHNIYGNFNIGNDGNVEAIYNAGVQTADANFGGTIRYGGTYPNARVTQHELDHWLGSGTYWAWAGMFDQYGGWTGAKVSKIIQQFDGDGARMYRAGSHFYPYGLNYDNEVNSDAVFMRGVAIMYAMRQDMGGDPNPWTATNVTLAASDPAGFSAFNWFGGGWSNAGYQGWSDLHFPHSGAAYSTGAFSIRTPQGYPGWTFGGDSLTVNIGGQLLYNGWGTEGVVTIHNLTIAGGTLKHDQFPQDLFQLGGSMTLAAAGGTVNAANGNIRILAPISGAGALNITGGYTTTLSGANTFTGNLTISSSVAAAFGANDFTTNGRAFGSFGNEQTIGKTVTINSGGTVSFTAGNVLGSGGSTIAQAPVMEFVVNPGGVLRTAAPAAGGNTGGGDANIFGPIALNGGTFTTGNGYNVDFQAATFLKNVTVGGTSASTINSNASNTAANGIMLGDSANGTDTITFNVGNATGDAAVDLTVSAKLRNSANSTSNPAAIGALTKTGAGTMVLAGANTYTGATNVNAGTLAFTTSPSTIGSVTVADSAVLRVQSAGVASTTLTTTGLTLGTSGPTSLTFDFNSQDSTVPMISTGVFTANGTVNLTFQNGALLTTGMHKLIGYTSFAGGGTFPGGPFALGPRGSGTLVNGPDGLYLNVTGGDRPLWTGLDNGNWQTAATGSNKNWKLQTAATATDYLEGDNVLFDDTAAGSTAIAINSSHVSPAAMTFTNSSKNYTVTSSGAFGIGGVGALTKNGSGMLTLSTSNTFTGNVIVHGGTLHANAANAATNRVFSYVNGITVNNGATLRSGTNSLFGWDGTQAKPVTVNGGTLISDTGGDVNVSIITLNGGALTGNGNANGWGSWNFGRATDKKLVVTENATVSATEVGFHNGATIEVASGKKLAFTGTITNSNDGVSAVVKQGPGTLTLSGTNSYTGATTINEGMVSISANNHLGANAAPLTLNGGTLRTTNTTALGNTHAFTIGGTGGTLTIAGNGAATTGQGDRVFFGNTNTLLGSGPLTVTGGGTLAGAAPNTTTAGAGALVLGASNSYSGTVTLQGGGLIEFAAANSLGIATVTLGNEAEFTVANATNSSNTVIVNGGTNSVLAFNNAPGTSSGPITLNANLTVGLRNWYNYANPISGTISGVVSGTGGLTVNSGTGTGGTLTLGGFNTFIGDVNVSASTVVANVTNNTVEPTGSALGNPQVARNINVNNAGTLKFTGADTFGSANTDVDATLVVNAGGTVTNNGDNFNTLGPVQLNGGTLTGTGGAVTAYQMYNLRGTVTVGGAAASTISGSGTNSGYHLAAPTTFNVADATAGTDLTVSATLINQDGTHGGSGALTKTGPGTMVLSATNTYSGATSVNAGTLVVNGNHAGATGAVTVAANATLGGNGNLGGNVTISANGIHSLAVATTPGTQVTRTITGSLTNLSGNILNLTASSVPAAGVYTLLTGTGGISALPSSITGFTGGVVSISGNSLILTVSNSAYGTWASSKSLTGANNGSTQDPDFDGIPNILEFVLDGNPLASDTGKLPKPSQDATNFYFDFDRRDDSVAEVTLALEYGTALAVWPSSVAIQSNNNLITGPPVTITNNGGGTHHLKVSVAKSGNTKLFGRLKAVK